jgi:hypothetical protein
MCFDKLAACELTIEDNAVCPGEDAAAMLPPIAPLPDID